MTAGNTGHSKIHACHRFCPMSRWARNTHENLCSLWRNQLDVAAPVGGCQVRRCMQLHDCIVEGVQTSIAIERAEFGLTELLSGHSYTPPRRIT